MLTDGQRSMSTKNGAVLSTQIVPEVLINKEKYKEWSIRLRTYLMAQDVWDVLEPTPTFVDVWDVAVEMAWKRKNATALHAIHISCGPDAFSLIEHITNAKEAWDKLAESMVTAGPEPLIQAAIQGDTLCIHEQLQKLNGAFWSIGVWSLIRFVLKGFSRDNVFTSKNDCATTVEVKRRFDGAAKDAILAHDLGHRIA
ncbi:hypothetical protein FEM48_Zijuj03G0043900 [Ziziphus jujuba var. spinosa]|uniref:DUF4219 domain-containing protein n=1 Tax=Ziziphus jujuba var. spinosa TaxID=714518 RepID=A0A978VN59_ZIZJJ|nr:hypothetical protein FEM48_Zijuj03G0043900 [Ziziphus jujuba var. spinosa]